MLLFPKYIEIVYLTWNVIFVWVLVGDLHSDSQQNTFTSLLAQTTFIEDLLRKFWETEGWFSSSQFHQLHIKAFQDLLVKII